MEQETVIEKSIAFVKETLAGAEGGHDWQHISRVWNTAKYIAGYEKSNQFVVELGALFHDIADSKFHRGDESIGPKMARDFLLSIEVDEPVIEHVIKIIEHVSFKGGNEPPIFKSPELDIVQDADRLDAIGAIGIARTFSYGGFLNREIYNPDIPPNLQMTREEYKKSAAPVINHFYEKLLLLKDRMNTGKGRELAIERHDFMEQFLAQFYREVGKMGSW
ncbi:MAG: HD domain-containing protein [Bacteroidota bacterium]